MKSIVARLVSGMLIASALSGCAGLSTAAAPAPAVSAPAAPGISAQRLGRLTHLLRGYVDQGRIAGAVVKIQQDGRDIYSEAVGLLVRGGTPSIRI